MSTPPDPAARKADEYVLNADTPTEMVRLATQGQLLTEAMGGLFPERGESLAGVERLLDVACGPGDWAIAVARDYYPVQVVGIDISRQMVEYATARAQSMGFDNCSFQVMDATGPLDFSGASFDLVNARFVVGFLDARSWPAFVREMARVLRPGGVLRLTEPERVETNKPSLEKLADLALQALSRAGKSFGGPGGERVGITEVLPHLLSDAGLLDVQTRDCRLVFDAGLPAHEPFAQNLRVGYELIKPFVIRAGVSDQGELDALLRNAELELLSPDFRGSMPIRTAWGSKAGA